MIIIGLTGSIGMGKSTLASMLQHEGVPVHDSDVAVHEIMAPGGPAVAAIAEAFPVYKYPKLYGKTVNGVKPIMRKALGRIVFEDENLLQILENITHPLVQQSQDDFIRAQKALGVKILALDIPLLFETGAENRVDYTIVVSAPFHIQRQRVLARAHMDEEKFEAILARQMPDSEKCVRADFIVHSGVGRAHMMKELKNVLVQLRTIDKGAA